MAVLIGIFATLLFSIPVLGYIGGMITGIYALITGESILGGYKKMRMNRIYSALLICICTIAWLPVMLGGDDLKNLTSRYMALATVLLIISITYQVFKSKTDTRYHKKAIEYLNAAWQNNLCK
ncbi:hypothetical protein IPC705_27965 [Pseudomonas aeruginosa]|nr:hypothetical protein IPC705_27965 [Pseudomonas aeruginosa]